MRVKIAAGISAALFLLAGGGAVGQTHKAGPEGDPSGAQREQVWWVPMQDSGKTLYLETTVYRPQGAGPFPLVIINHGSPREARVRRDKARIRFFEQSRWFVYQGYAVVIPMRRGYGGSDGKWAESYGTCNNPNYVRGGLSTAADIGAVIRYFKQQSFVDRNRLLLVGHSAGGFGSIAFASRNPAGVIGVVNFAGGRGSIDTNTVCTEQRLIEAMGHFGQTARIPSIWLYAENDLKMFPKLAHRMFDAYREGGAPADFFETRSFRHDGHTTFSDWDGSGIWIPLVSNFMAGLPAR